MDLLHHPYLTSHASDRTLRRFRELAEAKADIEPGTPSTPNTSQRTLQVGETESLKYIQGGSWRLSVPGNRSSEAGNRSSEAGTAAVAVAVAPSKAHTADDMSRAAAVPLTPTMTSVDSSSSLQVRRKGAGESGKLIDGLRWRYCHRGAPLAVGGHAHGAHAGRHGQPVRERVGRRDARGGAGGWAECGAQAGVPPLPVRGRHEGAVRQGGSGGQGDG